MVKITFGKRRVEYGDIEYDILADGGKVGEIKKYYDGETYCCDSGSESRGVDISEWSVREAKQAVKECFAYMTPERAAEVVREARNEWGD